MSILVEDMMSDKLGQLKRLSSLVQEEGHEESKRVANLIVQGRTVYYSSPLAKPFIDKIIQPILISLKNKRIWYQHRHDIKSGVLLGLHNDIVRVRQDGKVRRLGLKNLYIFDEALHALISMYK